MGKILIESTTDTPEQVQVAMGDVAQGKEVEASETEQSEPVETTEESETSETQDVKEDESEEEVAKEGDEDEDDAAEEGEKSKKRNGFKRRVDKLNKRIAEREREVEYWRNIALKAKSQEPQQEKPQAPKQIDTSKKPNPDDFETHEEFIEALTDWVEQKLKEHQSRMEAESIQSERRQMLEAHKARVKEFAAKHEDFDEVMEDVADVPVGPALYEIVVASEVGPQVLYELAKNRSELERINSMPAHLVGLEVGKLIATISSSETKPKKKQTTKAPKPLSTVGGKSTGSVAKSIYDPNISFKEYERLRAEQERRRA